MRKITIQFFMFFLITSLGLAQTKGLIYKPAGNALGKSVLDPNGDGYTSPTISGFSVTDYGTGSELNMVALPTLIMEPAGDLTTGPNGGHTDLVNNGQFQSSYVMYRNVGGIDYLIVRIRLGGSSTAPKGYTLLIDSDNNSANNYSSSNPCFEREVVLQPGNGVIVNSLNATVTQLAIFDANNYQQRSIALSNISGTPDYFYDFFVPVSALNVSGPVRMLVSTVIAAGQSGIQGGLSDVNGVNDSLYNGNTSAVIQDVIGSFPSTTLTTLTSGGTFASLITSTPDITTAISTNTTSISGSSQEANGTVITVYKNGVSIGTTTVTNNSWTLTGVSGLIAGNLITATALATSKSASAISSSVEVTGVQTCFTPIPLSLTRTNGSQNISGTWTNGQTIVANTVRIRLYSQTAFNQPFVEIAPSSTIYVQTNGTWSFPTGLTQSTFNNTNIYATATINGCTSSLSDISKKTSGQSGTTTSTPTITTTQILASPTVARTVSVTNNHATASILILYVNGVEVSRTTTAINSGSSHPFNFTGFIEGDIVTARAQRNEADFWLSNISNSVTVTASTTVTTAPTITTTTLTAGTGKTISGTSVENAGTVISIYKAGNVLLGTATVDAFGSWSLTNVTLATNDVITATAKALGETTSVASNSVTVVASLPAAPVVTSPIFVGATTISGTSGQGTTTIYADGVAIGTATGASWSLTGIDPLNIYRGAQITAKNTVSGVQSALSNVVTVQGAASFCITDLAGNPITTKNSGELFNIKITAITGLTCPGTVYTGFTGSVVLSSSTSILSGAGSTANFVNGVLTTTAIALGAPGTGVTINAINSTDPTATGSSSLDVTNTAWKGTTSTDFNTASNWVGNFVPLAGAYIFYFVPTDRDCHLDQNRTVGAINFNGTDKNMNINGHTLTVSGVISGITGSGGRFTGGNTSNLTFDGSGNAGTFYMDQTTPLTTNVLNNLTVNQRSSGSVTLANALNITGILAANAGTLNTGNDITFKSNANKTAIVAPVTGTISGEVTVERYIPAKRAFRFVTSAVTTTTSIKANWQENQNNATTSSNSNTNPGWGTHITGSTSGVNGFDATQTTNPSMFAFVNSSGNWAAGISNTDVNTLTAGVPYRLMIRGSRSVDLNSNTAAPSVTTLRSKGTLYTGTKTVNDMSALAGGDNFVGNPYQSPVDMNAVLQASSNLNTVFYTVWDPNINTRGAYVTVNVGTNVSNNNSSAANKYLQAGQGCFVNTNVAGAASITFQESHKQSQTNNVNVFKQKANNQANLRLKLYEANALTNNKNAADALLIEFDSNRSNNVDMYDAKKLTNIDENFALKNNTSLLSIESRTLPVDGEIIPLHINQYRNTNYTIVAEVNNVDGFVPFLKDKFTNTSTEIKANESVKYNYLVDNANVASKDANRFEIVFKSQSTLGTETIEFADGFNIHPNPVNEGFVNIASSIGTEGLEVEMHNILGQKVNVSISNRNANNIKINVPKVTAKGIYFLNLKQNGQTTTKKIVIN